MDVMWTNSSNCSSNCSWDANANVYTSLPPITIFPVPVLIGVTVTCVLFFLAGVAGNLTTIMVVFKYKEMRTTTNLYLSSMAFSDLLIFLCLPLDLYRMWRYRPWTLGNALCKLFQFVSECCTYSTILNMTALSAERYFAICFPLRAKVTVTKRRVRGLILALWTVALCSAGPVFVLVGVEHENGTDWRETSECKATEYGERTGLLSAMVWVSSGFFLLPVFCLTVLYGLIGRKLWRRKRRRRDRMKSRDSSNRQTIKMLAVMVFAFVLCWLPFHVGRYLFSASPEAFASPLWSLISQYCSLISFVLFYLSAAINPILYNAMSKKYRNATLRLFSHSSPSFTESSISC
ncbi:growth hormone secretagogue receptor a [Ictalurus furcatus]|uniref:growth hormone secretagogue receptor a n=1 Tax=Ictalurus furcatus TaxID=66913 RepID=UPI0023504035|nr:growth hormone secretagogue receptor a [Ictalurus furcatus]